MEIALLADGVPAGQLYPLDLPRAIKSLERIKPHVAVWYKSGAQSAQLLKDGEVDMVAIWGSRIAPLVNEGEPVAFTFQQGLLNSACFAIPKGAKQAHAAQKMIAAMVSPGLQANIPQFLELYGPVNSKAFEARAFSAAELSKINSSPANRQMQVVMDARFWGANLPRATEMYRNLMAP